MADDRPGVSPLARRRGAGSLALRVICAVIGVVAVAIAVLRLDAAGSGVEVTDVDVEGTPVRIFRPAGAGVGPVVLIAHGFAGSQQLMQSFALTFARNGYTAVTFDFPGHGRNPKPLSGSIVEESGATRVLVDETARVAAFARTLGDGRVAVLGHSMASDIVVRFAQASPDVSATIAVSMFSPAVTASSPRNLLVIVGEWEGMLIEEALRAVGLAVAPERARPGVTYGDLGDGTARRVAISPHVEHASVLFSRASMGEALAWVDQTFGVERAEPARLDGRGPFIMLLVAGVVLLAWPLSTLLPRVSAPAVGAGLGWLQLWLPLLLPPVATPLVLRVLPTHFLPVLVGDYLAAHFAVYGLMTGLCLLAVRRPDHRPNHGTTGTLALAVATLAVIAFFLVAMVIPIDRTITSFVPGPERWVLVLAMLAGTLWFFVADEWLTRGPGSARGAYAATKVAFLVSLAIAVALDFERLFFLIIIVPVIVLFFLIFGLFSAWIYRSTGNPLVAALSNAVAFAWAIGVTFPLLSG
jgi:pimeloyl-ACP methyl ester carboxylesterase